MADNWYGDGWEDDQWDSSGWEDESQKMRRSGGRGWMVGAVILVAIGALGIFLFTRLNNTPEQAARVWLQAVTKFDRQKSASLTCANAINSQQTGGQMGSEVLTLLQDGGNILQELGVPLDISAVAQFIEFDIHGLKFDTLQEDEEYAMVHVSGLLSVSFKMLSLPLQLDEDWIMAREEGRWKWCGR